MQQTAFAVRRLRCNYRLTGAGAGSHLNICTFGVIGGCACFDMWLLLLCLRLLAAEVVQMYLQKNAALAMTMNKTDGSTTVSAACQGGQDSILQLLLATLRVSAISNTFDPAKRLLDHVDSSGMTALAAAAAASPCSPGHLACAHILLQSGCSLLPQDQAGRSCLHHAAAAGSSQLVELLLEAAQQQQQQQQQACSEQDPAGKAAVSVRR